VNNLRHHSSAFILLVMLCLGVSCFGTTPSIQSSSSSATVRWRDCLRQKPEWYASAEATRIADNLLLYQRDSGGWPKNTEMAAVLTEKQQAEVVAQKKAIDATIDNQSTYTQLAFLARVIKSTSAERYRKPFFRGLDYLLSAQYQNGGWPQFYPHPSGYQKYITFNDDAMIGVLNLLRDIARQDPNYSFVDQQRRARSAQAVTRGTDCILKCQIKVAGRRTGWCAQHDEVTFAPAPARTYEKISLSGGETVGIVRFLMGIEHPSPRVIDAIEGAVAWLDQVKLRGIKIVIQRDAALARGFDRVVVEDPKAEPIWARFYEIGTNRPIFCGRDGVIKSSLAEIEYERRTGYSWYVTAPAELLAKDYPAWRKTVGRRQWAVGSGQ
jgi:PelA/Pel-15E family pectate lyase